MNCNCHGKVVLFTVHLRQLDAAGKLFRRGFVSNQNVEKILVFMIRSILEDSFRNCSRHPPQSLGGTTCTRLESGGAALSALTPVACMESHIHLGLASWLQGHPPQRQLSSATKNQHMASYQHISITRTSFSKN